MRKRAVLAGIAVLGGLAALGVLYLWPAHERSKAQRALEDTRRACQELLLHDGGSCKRWQRTDAWGGPIECRQDSASGLSSVSYGADRQPKGSGPDADVTCTPWLLESAPRCTCRFER
jgi:hypothetical protein